MRNEKHRDIYFCSWGLNLNVSVENKNIKQRREYTHENFKKVDWKGTKI